MWKIVMGLLIKSAYFVLLGKEISSHIILFEWIYIDLYEYSYLLVGGD
jgi:hypothetical protein